MRFVSIVLTLLAVCIGCNFLPAADQGAIDQEAMQVEIDARDLPRKLLHARLEIPLTASASELKVALWFPKWVPGSHGPGGPVANVAGLRIEDQLGNKLSWQRTPGEVYRLEVTVPPNTEGLKIWIRYITNQPTTGSMGHDSWGSSKLGVISPNTILLYPEAIDVSELKVSTTLILPGQWTAATALPREETAEGSDSIRFKPVSLACYVDSPIMCGAHHKTFDLVEPGRASSIPAHRLQVFGDEPSQCELDAAIVNKFRSMVTQAALLIGSHPFDQFEILLGVTKHLPANGLEHAKSTFNVLHPSALTSPSALQGWNRLLIPHEYMHAWCGKYRRPAGMISKTFHTPENTELLWVYEGLTQYLGELIEARCGLMTRKQFAHRVLVELRNATHSQGREWRSLADTGAAAHILRSKSLWWPGLRRSQDFYMEGMLFWLEADAILRKHSNGTKSLDDFCREFFSANADSPRPNPFTREDLVSILNSLQAYDWDGLILRRIESLQGVYDPSVADILGYRFELQSTPLQVPPNTFRYENGVENLDSIGATFSNDGEVQDILLGSPADQARLMPGMKIIGVGKNVWTPSRFSEALEEANGGSPIELKIIDGDEIKTIEINYHDGPRWLNLVRQNGSPDLLSEITKPLRR